MNIKLLKEYIKNNGYTYTFIAKKMCISRESLYKKLKGQTEFKASELNKLSILLHLSEEEASNIFFN